MKTFGKIIMEHRKLAGFTRLQVAEVLRKKEEHIRRLEEGEINPPWDHNRLMLLSLMLKIPFGELCHRAVADVMSGRVSSDFSTLIVLLQKDGLTRKATVRAIEEVERLILAYTKRVAREEALSSGV